MSRLNRLIKYFTGNSTDASFETYYGTLIRSRQGLDGAPNASEARRDFESVRRVMDKTAFY